jgi:hypothetical protein
MIERSASSSTSRWRQPTRSRCGRPGSRSGGRPITRYRRRRGLTVVLEGRAGGRIFERTTEGVEHEWGEVTVWNPPSRLAYLWHLRRDRADATEVEVRFVDRGDATTRVEIVHRGWERLGTDDGSWRDRNEGGWATLLPHYRAAVTA